MADTEGFEDFYIATVGRLLGQLFPVIGDLHEAEEVVQEAFARASTRWSRIRDYDVPEAWVQRAGPLPSVPPVSVEARWSTCSAPCPSTSGRRSCPPRRHRRPGGRDPPRPAAPATHRRSRRRHPCRRPGRRQRRHEPAGRPVGPAGDLTRHQPAPLPNLDLDNQANRSGVDRAESTLDKGVDRCPGGSTAYGTLIGLLRSAEFRRLVVLGGKPPALGEPTICWTVGVFDPDGSGKLFGPVKPVPIATPLTANVQGSGGHGTIYGQADMRTHRVRVRFRDQPTILDVPANYGLYRWDVNFYVGLFPPGWVPVEVTSFDAEGRQLAGCAIDLSASRLPRCPGN